MFYTRKKSIFFQNWFDKNILLISQLMNSQGLLFSYEEFLDHFQISCLSKIIFHSYGVYPIRCCCFTERYPSLSPVSPKYVDTFVGRLCFASPCNNIIG